MKSIVSTIAVLASIAGVCKYGLLQPTACQGGGTSCCSAGDAELIVKELQHMLASAGDRFLEKIGNRGYFEDFLIEKNRRNLSEKKNNVRRLQGPFGPYYGSGECRFCGPDDDDRIRRNLQTWESGFEDHINARVKNDIRDIIKRRDISESCIDASLDTSLGGWTGTFEWIDSECQQGPV